MSPNSSTIELEGLNTYYRILTNFICDSYDFTESANDYGATVNPWKFSIYRSTDPDIPLQDVSLVGAPVYGYRHNEVMKHLIGEKFLFGHKFDDLTYLLPVSTKTEFTTNKVQVFRNPLFSKQTTPRLQLTPNGTGTYNTSGKVESISLYNGDPNIEPMGQLNNCRVRIYGVIPVGTSVLVEVCRNGGQSYGKNNLNFLTTQRTARNWITVGTFNDANKQTQNLIYVDRLGVSHTASTNVISVNYWEGTISFSGSESHKNSLAYRLTFTGSGTTTPYLEYIHFDCNTVSDTGIVSGTIDTYTDSTSVAGSEFFEGNLEGNRRLDGIRDVRLSTINTTDELSHFWDTWINTSGALNFKQRRGTDLVSPEFSFESKKFKDIKYEFDGSDIWWKCVAYGAGSGEYRTRIVSDEEFSAGGLKSAAVKAAFVNAARIGRFEDTNAVNISQLLRKARAAFKLHQQPYETLTLPSGLIPQSQAVFDVGDSIHIVLTDLDVDKQFPVQTLTYTVDGDGENVKVTLGEPLRSLAGALTNLHELNEEVYVVRQPSGQSLGNTGAGTMFDKDHYGVFTFGITAPEDIKKVAIKAVTVPFDAPVRASKSGSAHTHTVTGMAIDGGGGGLFDAQLSNTSASGSAGGQSLTTGNVADRSLSGAIAAGQTLTGATDNNSDMSPGISQGNSIHSITVSATSGVQTQIGSTISILGTDDLIFIEVWGYNDSSTAHPFAVALKNGSTPIHTQVAATPSDGLAADSIAIGVWSYIADADLYTSGLNIYIESLGTGYTDEFMLRTSRIKKHNHNKGTLNGQNSNASGSIVGGLTGNSGGGSASTTLSAAQIYNLFSNMRLGYESPPTGTGTGTAFTQNGITYYTKHTHPVTGTALGFESDHTHGMDFGIYVFSGDSDSLGNGPPVYGTSIELWVDPTNETTPETAAKLPVLFGSSASAVEIDELDITNYLARDNNGIIKRGMHKVFIKSGTGGGNNTKGLGKLQIVVLDEHKAV